MSKRTPPEPLDLSTAINDFHRAAANFTKVAYEAVAGSRRATPSLFSDAMKAVNHAQYCLDVACDAYAQRESDVRAKVLKGYFGEEIAEYARWFAEEHNRNPATLRELADYLDDERDNGRFADHSTVNWVFELSEREDAADILDAAVKLEAERRAERRSGEHADD